METVSAAPLSPPDPDVCAPHIYTGHKATSAAEMMTRQSHTNHLSFKATKTKFHRLEGGQKSLISLSNANSPEQFLAAATASPQVANLVK